MIKSTTKTNTKYIIEAVFNEKDINADIAKEMKHITEFPTQKKAFIYLGKKSEFNKKTLKGVATTLVEQNVRGFQVDISTFVTKNVSENEVITNLVEQYEFKNAEVYNKKTSKKKSAKDLLLVNLSSKGQKHFKEAKILADGQTYARNLGMMAPNVLTSVAYADKLKADFGKMDSISVKVLNKKQITSLKMGLFLSVNLGSAYEPRVVVLEYKGKPSSKQKTVMVGKGIVYDAGGYNIKTGPHMANMKFDMLGSATIAGAMKAIGQLKPKSNVSAVLMLTDNMINSIASKPDDVYTAMNGKTVEINNTDAEGRLAMADGLTYAAKKLNATTLMDAATLTGAMVAAMGHTYTGAWATNDKLWTRVNDAASAAGENVWRMPFHCDFLKFMKGSKVADLKNTALDGLGGANTAAAFLKEFTEGVEYAHFDIAGTADWDGIARGALVKTLVEVNK